VLGGQQTILIFAYFVFPFYCCEVEPLLTTTAALTEAGAALVGAGGVGEGGGGPIANDFSTNTNPNNAANTNAEHAPMIFFILGIGDKLVSCHKMGRLVNRQLHVVTSSNIVYYVNNRQIHWLWQKSKNVKLSDV
jgi:hypothetical protein